MTKDEKVAAISAVISEHAALYAALQASNLPAGYDGVVVEGLHLGLTQKIAAVFADKP